MNMGEFPSGQRGQTVNLLAMPSVVRIHLPPPNRNGDCDTITVPVFWYVICCSRLESSLIIFFIQYIYSFSREHDRCGVLRREFQLRDGPPNVGLPYTSFVPIIRGAFD